MKLLLGILSTIIGVIALTSCQPKSNTNTKTSDTAAIYGNPAETGQRAGDTVIERGMGDSVGIQTGGTKVNVGKDTVGDMPHDK